VRVVVWALLLSCGCHEGPHAAATLAPGAYLSALYPNVSLDVAVRQIDVVWAPSTDAAPDQQQRLTVSARPETLRFRFDQTLGEPGSDVPMPPGVIVEAHLLLDDGGAVLTDGAGTRPLTVDGGDLLVWSRSPMEVRFAHAAGLVLAFDPKTDLDGDRLKPLTGSISSADFTAATDCRDWNDCDDWIVTYRAGTPLGEIERMTYDFGALILNDDVPFHEYVTVRPPAHAGFWEVSNYYEQFPSVVAALPNFPLYLQ